MKFKSKNGRVYNDRIAMTLANVRHRFSKKTEDDFMDYEEFADDYDESLDEDSDEPGSECDSNNDGTDDSNHIDNNESATNDEIESTITRVDDDCFLVSTQPKRFRHDGEPLVTGWHLNMTDEYIEDFQKRADDMMHRDTKKMYDNMIPIPEANVHQALDAMKNIIKSTDILDEEIDEAEPEQL